MEDDILEYALNFGIEKASIRYNILKDKVKEIVNRFALDVSNPCMCEQAKANGFIIMCFYCSGREMSMTLKERLSKM